MKTKTQNSEKASPSLPTPRYAESNFEILRKAAEISDWGHGRWAYDSWSKLNDQLFDGRLKVGGIFWGLTPHGGSLGYYSPDRNAITLHTSLVMSSANPWGVRKLLGERYATDVLFHEMMHQWNLQIDGTCRVNGESHNQPLWCDLINVMVPKLGLKTDLVAAVVKQRRVNGKVTWLPRPGFMARIQLATFPYKLRPAGFYESETAELQARLQA
jgi:hypothetical protein